MAPRNQAAVISDYSLFFPPINASSHSYDNTAFALQRAGHCAFTTHCFVALQSFHLPELRQVSEAEWQ